jgi:RNA polymerase sigma-70 factor (ECF subfamily)
LKKVPAVCRHFFLAYIAFFIIILNRSIAYDDKTFFAEIAEGNEAAFTALFEAYVVQMGSFVYSLTRSEKVVDDIIQETFLRIWINRDKLTGVREPRSYLFRIAANLCYTWRNRLMLESRIINDISGQAPAGHDGVTEQLHVNALKAAVQEAVNRLSPQRAKIYQLNRQEGWSVSEIAEHLSLSQQTVRNTLSSSLDFIREYLQKKGYPLVLISLLLRLF